MSWKSLTRLFSGIRGAYNDINPSTLTGAIDVLVIEQPDGSFRSGPFHVRFGKLTAISPADKIVEVFVNGVYIDFLKMRLGSAGDAYFVKGDQLPNSLEKSMLRISESGVPRWVSSSARRRRRRVRRNTAQSEPDAPLPEQDDLPDHGPQSDCEPSDLLADSFSPLSHRFESNSLLTHSCDSSSQDFEWDWGSFPHRKSNGFKSTEGPAIETPGGFSLPDVKLEREKLAPADVSQMKTSDGVYLEDLMTPEVDQTIKETYIYPPMHRRNTACESPHSRAPVDPNGCIDAGYRSDGEHSPRSLSPIHPNVFGLHLSLCGCPPLGTSISEAKFLEHLVSYDEFIRDPEAILSNPNLTIYLNGKYVNWQVAAPSIVSVLAFQTELPHHTLRRLESLHMRKKEVRRTSWFSWGTRTIEAPVSVSEESKFLTVPSLQCVSECDVNNRLTEGEKTLIAAGTVDVDLSTQRTTGCQKSNRLTSDEIAALHLNPGRNDVEFRVTTKYQGTCICSASIFVWHWSDRIVVSDVDGTITRSDVLGHLLPMLGHDWTHIGVARLYNKIAQNGYRFLYLSTRALGQAGITRSYLRQVVQETSISLPEGPILLSPNSLLHAFHQEVIEKKPENFKIQCLLDVCSLFPQDSSPFYAGFGNKRNDVFAYRKAGMEPCRIFTINPRGEVLNQFHTNKVTSYIELSNMVDHYFPLLSSRIAPPPSTYFVAGDDSEVTDPKEVEPKITTNPAQTVPTVDMSIYSCFTYWRTPDCADAATPNTRKE